MTVPCLECSVSSLLCKVDHEDKNFVPGLRLGDVGSGVAASHMLIPPSETRCYVIAGIVLRLAKF